MFVKQDYHSPIGMNWKKILMGVSYTLTALDKNIV